MHNQSQIALVARIFANVILWVFVRLEEGKLKRKLQNYKYTRICWINCLYAIYDIV